MFGSEWKNANEDLLESYIFMTLLANNKKSIKNFPGIVDDGEKDESRCFQLSLA